MCKVTYSANSDILVIFTAVFRRAFVNLHGVCSCYDLLCDRLKYLSKSCILFRHESEQMSKTTAETTIHETVADRETRASFGSKQITHAAKHK